MKTAILAGTRTPFLRSGTDFADVSAIELGKLAVKDALARSGLPAERIDHLVYGTVVHDTRAPNIAREVAERGDVFALVRPGERVRDLLERAVTIHRANGGPQTFFLADALTQLSRLKFGRDRSIVEEEILDEGLFGRLKRGAKRGPRVLMHSRHDPAAIELVGPMAIIDGNSPHRGLRAA